MSESVVTMLFTIGIFIVLLIAAVSDDVTL